MAILGLQQSQAEIGRIRLGVFLQPTTGKGRPSKLDRFRFTSPYKSLLDEVARLYGGTVQAWTPQNRTGSQWEVITTITEVPVVIPPQDPAEGQWYEMWSKGGCQRRCDGQTEKLTKQPCLCVSQGCPVNERDCKLHTRIRVMLADVPSMGAWLVDTSSYYAATELPGVAALLAMAGGVIPGILRLSPRSVVRKRKTDGAPVTFNFVVPVLDIDGVTPRELMAGRVQDLVAARAASALDGAGGRQAIGATADYPAAVAAATTVDELREVFKQAGKAGKNTPELKALIQQRIDALAVEDSEDDEVFEGELVEWPETATVGGAR